MQLPPAPQQVDHREYQQGQQHRTEHPPHHRRRQPAHHLGPGAAAPENWQQSYDRGSSGHQYRAHPQARSLPHRVLESLVAQLAAFLQQALPTLVKVYQHYHAGFHRNSGESDHPHPHGNGKTVIQQVHQPDAAHQRQGQRPHQNQHLGEIAEIEVEQHDDDSQGKRHDIAQTLFGPLHVFVLAGPHQ